MHVSGGLNGEEVWEDFEYDGLGREIARSGPYYRGSLQSAVGWPS